MAIITFSLVETRLLVAIARSTAGKLLLQQALALELDSVDPNEEGGRSRLKDAIRRVLHANSISRGDATVVVSRDQIEMRQFTVPVVPDEELPDLVRFQARSHFTSLNEKWLLDFIPIATTGNSMTVLAAAISPEQVELVRRVVEPSGLKLKHIVLRPFSAAELLHHRKPDPGCRLLVEIIGRQADISIVNNDYVLLTRTVRVPESYSGDQFNAWLPGEVRRTIAAARNQADAPPVESIVILGGLSQHKELKSILAAELDIPVELFSPFQAVPVSRKLVKPDRPDGYASLIGSLVQQTSQNSHALDFLNPRKKPEPKNKRRALWIAVGSSAAVFLLFFGVCWSILNGKDRDIAQLKEDIRNLNEQNKGADTVIGRVGEIDKWKQRDIVWLEELYELSKRFPLPDAAIVDSFAAHVATQDAVIGLQTRVLDRSSEEELIKKLEERPFIVVPGVTKESASKVYGLDFTSDIRIPFIDILKIGTAQPDPTQQVEDTQPGSESTSDESAEDTPTQPNAN